MIDLNKRQLKCLELFLQYEKILNSKFLSMELNVSSRTIRSDIEYINNYLKSYNCKIVTIMGKGYSGEFTKEFFSIYKIRNFNNVPTDTEERLDYIIKRIVENYLENEDLFLSNLTKELYISESTLNNLLKKVKAIIEQYKVSVVIYKDKFYISGKEDKIKNFVVSILYKYFDLYIKKFKYIEVIKNIITFNIQESKVKLTDEAIDKFTIQIYIEMKKCSKNKENIINRDETLFATIEYMIVEKIIEHLNCSLNSNIYVDRVYLTKYLLASSRTDECIENDCCDDIILKLFYEIKDKFNIDFIQDAILRNSLKIHLFTLLNRIKYNINSNNDYVLHMKKLYPLAFEISIYTATLLEEILGKKILEDEIAFFSMHYAASFERNKNNFIKKKVLIVCQAGLSTSILLQEILIKEFGNEIEILGRKSLYDLDLALMDKVDLIISTIKDSRLMEDKTIFIEKLMDDIEIRKISKFLGLNKCNNKIDLSSFIKKDIFIENLKVKNKVEIIEALTNRMIDKNYMTIEEKHSLINRENISSTELGYLLAMPHIIRGNSNNNYIGIAILDKPILWDKEKVQVVIIININDSKGESWEKFFSYLYKYFIRDLKVFELIENRNYELFIKSLSEID